MVVIPPGEFVMGAPNTEFGWEETEGPQRKVKIRSFGVSKFEVTFEEWEACVKLGGCLGNPGLDVGWGRGRRPVINVSWDDARQYVSWLSKVTGKPYRLLSESEWEYAARSGTSSAYSWGDDIGNNNANCYGCGSKWDNSRTAPVGSFSQNAFGIHDMAGNVIEWVEDCWSKGYLNAPQDGSPRLMGDCKRRIARGGSWSDDPILLRSSSRIEFLATIRNDLLGFRVARTIQ
jgi:formylglycine-generating enzyme required for sulfatase activity